MPGSPRDPSAKCFGYKRVDKTKSFGVIVDENLAWDEQLKLTKSKISTGFVAFKRLNNIMLQR